MSTTYADPDGDIQYNWGDDTAGTNYTRVNDGVRSPTNAKTGGDGFNCNGGPTDDTEEVIFETTEPISSGTITEVKFWFHAESGSGGALNCEVRIWIDGSWQTADVVAVSAVQWYSKAYSGSWNAATCWPLYLSVKTPTMGKSDDLFVYAEYAEITYTTSGGGSVHSRTVIEDVGGDGGLALSDKDGGLGALITILRLVVHGKSLAETMGWSDATLKDWYVARLVAENIGFTESGGYQYQPIYGLLLTDRIGLSQLLTAVLYPVQLRAIIETLGISDGLTRHVDVFRVATESLALSDAVSRLVTYLRPISDNLGLSDSLRRLVGMDRAISETLGIADAVARNALLFRTQSESLALSELLTRNVAWGRVAIETASLSNAVVRIADALRLVSETAGIATDLDLHVIRPRQISEALGLADTVARQAVYTLATIEQLGVSDALARQSFYLRSPVETMALSESVLRATISLRQVSENLALSQQLSRIVIAMRSITASLGISNAFEQSAFAFPDATWFLPKRGRTYRLPERMASLN